MAEIDAKAKETLLSVRNLVKYFPIGGGLIKKATSNVHATDDVTPVSYTHLDVYKRQEVYHGKLQVFLIRPA